MFKREKRGEIVQLESFVPIKQDIAYAVDNFPYKDKT